MPAGSTVGCWRLTGPQWKAASSCNWMTSTPEPREQPSLGLLYHACSSALQTQMLQLCFIFLRCCTCADTTMGCWTCTAPRWKATSCCALRNVLMTSTQKKPLKGQFWAIFAHSAAAYWWNSFMVLCVARLQALRWAAGDLQLPSGRQQAAAL